MSNPWLFGKVENGKILLSDINLYHNLVHELEGKKIQLKIDELDLKYTDSQLNTYFGVVIGKHAMNISDFAGWTKEEIDDFFGLKFRSEYKHIRDPYFKSEEGLIKQITPVSKLSRKKFAEFIDKVILYLNEEYKLDIQIEKQ